MSNFKYKYYRLPPCGKAIFDIICCINFKDAKNIIVREKIDLNSGIFSNDGTGEYTFVEFAGYGVNETKDGVNLYGNGSLYIKRKDLRPTLLFSNPEKEFKKQIEEYIQNKKSFNETKEMSLSLAENGQSAIGSNQRLSKVVEQLKTENAELLETNYSLSAQVKRLLDLQKKVEKLIGLLKECRECMTRAEVNYGYDDAIIDIFSDIYKCINAAISESEEK